MSACSRIRMGIRAGHSGRRPAGYYDQCVENRSFCNVVNLRFYQVQTCEILRVSNSPTSFAQSRKVATPRSVQPNAKDDVLTGH